MGDLLDEGSDGHDATQLNINTDYAQKYENWRRKEELAKLKDKYGKDADGERSDSESSSSDDSQDMEWTESKEKAFLTTLAALKSKDPKIYKTEGAFFDSVDSDSDEWEEGEKKERKKKQKPMFLKDFERDLVVKKGGHYDEDEETETGRQSPSYVEKQRQLKDSLKQAVSKIDDDDFLVERVKSSDEKIRENDSYLEWLKGRKSKCKDESAKDLKPLKKYWQDPALNDGEKFLRDYILERKYASNDKEKSTPTYSDIVADPVSLQDDEEQLQREEQFEKQYNFRFEEPNATEIKSYPRKIEESVRRPDEKRSEKRKQIKERKEMEKKERKEELKVMKDMTRQEIEKKMEKLRHITGDPNLNLDMDDLNSDFDPAKYDRMMQSAFSEEYYGHEEGEEKPQFSDIDDDDDDDVADYDKIELKNTGKIQKCNNTIQEEEPAGPSTGRKEVISGRAKKRKSKLMEGVEKKKPLFDPGEMSLEDYVDKYYKLNYEDVNGDTVFRFKYRTVPANDFGLTDNELLLADDKELNAWVSLKKTSQYRNPKEEEMDRQIYKKKGMNVEKKKKILASVYEQKQSARPADEASHLPEGDIEEDAHVSNSSSNEPTPGTLSKSARRKQRMKKKKNEKKTEKSVAVSRKDLPVTAAETVKAMTDERLMAYGLNPKKTKNRSKYKK